MKAHIKTLVPQKKKKKALSQQQIIMIGLGSGAALGLGYLAYNHFRNKAIAKRSISDTSNVIVPSNNSITPSIITSNNSPVAASNFPLKIGSRGNLVVMLQDALMAKGGQAALIIKETSFRNGRLDGIFGKGTQNALRAAGFPTAISQSQFSTLVGNSAKASSSGFGASAISKEIIQAANTRNLFGVLNGLKKINSVDEYQKVSAFFQGVRILGIRVTSLVNALLSVAFKQKELEKVKIRAEFRRMGLKQNARGVWFIPGLGGTIGTFENDQHKVNNEWNLAIARKPTLLKAIDGSFIVPELTPNTVVGYITGMQDGITRILTQSGETVFAPTRNLSSF